MRGLLFCKNQLESQCDQSNDNGEMGAYFGYSGQTGGYPGGQAEYLRVPFANFTHFKIPESCEEPDEKLSVIADAMTTGFWSVDNAGVKKAIQLSFSAADQSACLLKSFVG